MSTALTFLALAKRCEIAELDQLVMSCELVGITGRLVHGLQLERGFSSLYLGSNGAQFAARRLEQIAACEPLEAELRQWFDSLDTRRASPGGRARLYGRIAYAQQGLESLAALRQQIMTLDWPARRAATAYRHLIAALLTVVFEAADDAVDPEVSRLLVAVFHLMQAKEFAGQERAIGAALLATGIVAEDERGQLLRLIESQDRCHRITNAFAMTAGRRRDVGDSMTTGAEQERLRRILLTCEPAQPLPPRQEAAWFEACTKRMDAMKACEDGLVADLLELCRRKIREARLELERYETLAAAGPQATSGEMHSAEMHSTEVHSAEVHSGEVHSDEMDSGGMQGSGMQPGGLSFFSTPAAEAPASHDPLWADGDERLQPLGPCRGRTALDLVCDQSRRLQTMKEELDTIRSTLNERKLIERAKGLLMAHRRLSEEQAHRVLQQLAMSQSRRLVDIAEAVLATSDVLAEPAARGH